MRFMTISLFLLMFSLSWNLISSFQADYTTQTGDTLGYYANDINVNTTALQNMVGADPNQSVRRFGLDEVGGFDTSDLGVFAGMLSGIKFIIDVLFGPFHIVGEMLARFKFPAYVVTPANILITIVYTIGIIEFLTNRQLSTKGAG